MITKAKVMTPAEPPRVYSYVRFSTPEQRMGDSERRQLEAAREWAKRKGYELDELTPDRGLSGFHGHHRTRGAFGKFLAMSEADRVPRGSTLVVENVDRLGREAPADALQEVIFKLWNRGVTIQTLSPEEIYEPGCSKSPKFIVLIILLQRAYDESQRKSERIKAVRAEERRQAREEGRKITGRVPHWIRVTWDRSNPKRPKIARMDPIPEAAAAVRRIFQMRLDGMGLKTIEKTLNDDKTGWKPPGVKGRKASGWTTGYIKKILTNVAVVGDFQPRLRKEEEDGTRTRVDCGEAVKGYFPEVVSREVFEAVQAKLQKDPLKGRRGRKKNLLVRLAVCECGNPMRIDDKGNDSPHNYLICDFAVRGVRDEKGELVCTNRTRVRYQECEDLVLDNCPTLKPEDVLPSPEDLEGRRHALKERVRAKKLEAVGLDRQIQTIAKRIGEVGDNQELWDALLARSNDLKSHKQKLGQEEADASKELKELEATEESFTAWQKGITELRQAIKDNPEVRERLNAHLRELIDRVEVFTLGKRCDPEGIYDAMTAGVEDPFNDIPDDLSDFCQDLAKRVNSKEGRFLRVHLKNDFAVDLVPPGSLALGERLDRTRHIPWRTVQPDLFRLYSEWRAGRSGE
jgi:DNA invertase Pin-like site-specific DNA recombinase